MISFLVLNTDTVLPPFQTRHDWMNNRGLGEYSVSTEISLESLVLIQHRREFYVTNAIRSRWASSIDIWDGQTRLYGSFTRCIQKLDDGEMWRHSWDPAAVTGLHEGQSLTFPVKGASVFTSLVFTSLVFTPLSSIPSIDNATGH